MLFASENFEAEFQGIAIKVTEHTLGEQQIFRIEFSDERKPLVVTKAKTVVGNSWMSVPQGRQKEATEIGFLIEEHFKNR